MTNELKGNQNMFTEAQAEEIRKIVRAELKRIFTRMREDNNIT